MWQAGEILWWLRQVPIPLPGGVTYRVDFQYQLASTLEVIWEDVKGRMTPMSKLKIAQAEEIFGIQIRLVRMR